MPDNKKSIWSRIAGKEDEAILKTKYAKYRKQQARNPDSVLKTLSYENWLKKRKKGRTNE